METTYKESGDDPEERFALLNTWPVTNKASPAHI